MSAPLRIGVIGCGIIAPAHVESYQRLESVEVVHACDLVEEKARGLAARYGIGRTSTDAAELFADDSVDAVSICTDHASHAPLAEAALAAGKHVLCEKALAATTEGLDRMMAAHQRRPALVFGGVFQHRFDANIQYLKRLVDRGALGTLLTGAVQVRCLRTPEYYRSDTWRGTWAEEGGAVLINQAIHFIDALCWIMGGVRAVAGAYTNRTHHGVMETEDTATASVRFASGALGTIEATCSSHMDWEYTLSLHGHEGGIDLRRGKGLKVSFRDPAREEEVARVLAAEEDEKVIDAGRSYYGASHPTQIADFVDAVRARRAPFVTAASARHTVDVVLGIYRSSREDRWHELPPSTP
jgi:predicted dehydrogenase